MKWATRERPKIDRIACRWLITRFIDPAPELPKHAHEPMPAGSHSHRHRHEATHHAHPHVPDAHHTHRH